MLFIRGWWISPCSTQKDCIQDQVRSWSTFPCSPKYHPLHHHFQHHFQVGHMPSETGYWMLFILTVLENIKHNFLHEHHEKLSQFLSSLYCSHVSCPLHFDCWHSLENGHYSFLQFLNLLSESEYFSSFLVTSTTKNVTSTKKKWPSQEKKVHYIASQDTDTTPLQK